MTVRVGLVGAGPWAKFVHAPVFAAGPETTLSAVWARRPEAASRLAEKYGAVACATTDELFDACDVVTFAVPPDVQARVAIDAARAGKAVVLEKPIALSLDDAERLAAAVDDAGVASMVVLSWRYADAVRAFVDDVRGAGTPVGARALFVSGAFLGDSPFATPWRLERGPLLDLGPHVLDLLDASVGRIVDVDAHGDLLGWVTVVCEHEGGAVSTASMSATVPVEVSHSGIEVYGSFGERTLDCASAVGPEAFATLRRELVETVRSGDPHPLDVHRGLHLQRLLDQAERQLVARMRRASASR